MWAAMCSASDSSGGHCHASSMNRCADWASTGSTQLSLLRKYRQTVRVESPAAAAMSSPLVPATPRSQNSAQAWRDTSNRARVCLSVPVAGTVGEDTSIHLLSLSDIHSVTK